MNNYLKEIMDSGKIYAMNDTRTIITDRMGPWSNQNLTLAWECVGHICVSPDEVEVLFANGRLTNVQRNYRGELYMEDCFADICTFGGAIVCGILPPSLQLRNGILEYAKKMGYVSDTVVPVEMFNGTKSLVCNPDGTYQIIYNWSNQTKKNCVMHLVYQFTKKYFQNEFKRTKSQRKGDEFIQVPYYSAPKIVMLTDGFIIDNLLENEVFHQDNIDAIREYDLQLGCLSTKLDKNLLLKALIQVGFLDPCPENMQNLYKATLRRSHPEVILPLYQYTPHLGENVKHIQLESGILLYFKSSKYEHYSVTYNLQVPYSEGIRTLMKNFETLMKHTYDEQNIYIAFEPGNESFYISVFKKEHPNYSILSQLEKDLVTLDYAISIFQKCRELNHSQLTHSVFRFLLSDSTFPFEEIFNFYYAHLLSLLSSK